MPPAGTIKDQSPSMIQDTMGSAQSVALDQNELLRVNLMAMAPQDRLNLLMQTNESKE